MLPGSRLIVKSSIPEILQLPWELLSHCSQKPGDIKGISVIRQTTERSPSLLRPDPSSGPLRVLFLAAGPLDYEVEERSILECVAGLDMNVAICESAAIEELRDAAERFKPHLLHIACQAKMSQGSAALSLQSIKANTSGAVLLNAEDIALALQGLGLFGVILSGRQKEPAAALHLLCQNLSETIPVAVAWNEETNRARPFYKSLADGLSLDEAIESLSCESLSSSSPSDQNCSPASLPALYSTSLLLRVIDPIAHREMPSVSAVLPCHEVFSIPGLNEGHADCFAGRRKEIAELLFGFRDGSIHALVITGPDGAGKSTLAVFLCNQMTHIGCSILPLYSSQNNPITSSRLLEAAAFHLMGLGKDSLANDLKDSKRSMRDRLRVLADALKSHQIIILWDDLDLDCQSCKIRDPDLAEFYLQMLRGAGKARLVVTCRSLPSDALTLPAKARRLELKGLYEAAFVRVLLTDLAVADRYRKGGISYAELAEHHHLASGLLSRLYQIRRALSLGDFSAGDDALSKIISALSPNSSHALCCYAVYRIAVNLEGIAAASGLALDQAKAALIEWRDLSLVYESGGLWSVSSDIGKSLLALLSPQEEQDANRRAAIYLRDQAEAGRASELGLSRFDLLMEARGHYLDAGDLDAAGLVTSRISGYLKRRGHHQELIRLNREILDLQSQSSSSIAWIAQSFLDQGEHRKAAEWYNRAIQISSDPSFYHGLGLALFEGTKLDQAKEALQKAVDAYHAAGDHSGEAASLGKLAEIDLKEGEHDAAMLKLEKIMEIMRLLGDPSGEAAVLQEAARLEMASGNHDSARARIVQSLVLLEGAKDEKGASFALFNLASLDLEKGDFTQASDEFTRALPKFREMGDLAAVAAILHSLGLIHSQAGEKEEAAKSFREALTISQSLADRDAEAGAIFQLGALAVQQNRMAEGLRLMALAAIVLRSIKSDEVKNVEPIVERLASQLNYSQEQFMVMVQEVLQGYATDRGLGMVEKVWEKQ
jgi:tetratricopeptide (TPR) repeat protein